MPFDRSRREQGESGRGVAVVLAIVLFAVLLVGGAVGAALFMMKRSPAYRVSEAFVRQSPEIRTVVGDRMEFSLLPRGSISAGPTEGHAELRFRVKGTAGSTQVWVLSRGRGTEWSVVSARYLDHDGQPRTALPENAPASGQPLPEPVRRARWHMANGFAFYRNGNYPGAIREYDKAIEANPKDPEAYYWRGVTWVKSGDDDRAIADFRSATELRPAYFEAYEYLDSVLARRNAWDTLVVYWTNFIEAQPDNGKAYYYRGGGYLRKGDKANALRDAAKSCALGYKDGCRIAARLRK